jgi:hypothetical protein
MAEEGNLGIGRAQDTSDDEQSKAELQRRMDEARDSISQTVTEIKDSVVHQYESVRESISETLDWREQFRKRPIAWAAGAAGAGFLTGYCVTSMIKGDGRDYEWRGGGYDLSGYDQTTTPAQNYRTQSYQAKSFATSAPQSSMSSKTESEDEGPGLISRLQETPAFEKIKNEAATVGNHLADEVSKTAKEVLVPAAIGWIRHWLEGILPQKGTNAQSHSQPAYSGGTTGQTANRQSYQGMSDAKPQL